MKELFDEKYFEDGIRNRVSAYENYRWMPERTIREASSIINNIPFENVLDYGCAKGFMVHALRLLGKQAYSVDISDYAIQNCHPAVKSHVKLIHDVEELTGAWDLIITKDVIENITKDLVPSLLEAFRIRTKQLFVIVPLGDGKRYRIREYEMDVTHIIREPEEWWLTIIVNAGFKIKFFLHLNQRSNRLARSLDPAKSYQTRATEPAVVAIFSPRAIRINALHHLVSNLSGLDTDHDRRRGQRCILLNRPVSLINRGKPVQINRATFKRGDYSMAWVVFNVDYVSTN